MTNILLISEDYIKTNSGLNDNVFGSYLTPAIRDAQDMGLQSIIGTSLYKSIMEEIDNDTLTEDNKYLLDEYIQIYLMYQTISDLVPIIGVKLTNLGVVISNDEHLTNLTQGDRELVQNFYKNKADFYAKRLQEFLLNNKEAYPALDECTCEGMKANLYSSASSGLWLGGLRSKRL